MINLLTVTLSCPVKRVHITVLHCRGGFFISFFELPGDTEASIFFRRECRGQQVYNDQFRAIKKSAGLSSILSRDRDSQSFDRPRTYIARRHIWETIPHPAQTHRSKDRVSSTVRRVHVPRAPNQTCIFDKACIRGAMCQENGEQAPVPLCLDFV